MKRKFDSFQEFMDGARRGGPLTNSISRNPMTRKRLQSLILQGFGQGRDEDYIPWIRVTRGNAPRVSNHQVVVTAIHQRGLHMMSRLEYRAVRTATWLGAGIFLAAKYISDIGFYEFKQSVLADPIDQLQILPFIGPITSWHLAKNLGLDAAKPDRHLVRLSERLGFRSADHLCRELAATTGEKAMVVDFIVWRYIADNPGQLQTSFA